jgi:hypothetical protein
MLGREQALERKGRQTSDTWSRGAEWYRDEIDRRYRAGDKRPVGLIWDDLSDRRLGAAEAQQTNRDAGARERAGAGSVP